MSSLVKRLVQQQTPVNISLGKTFWSQTFKYSCYLLPGMTEMAPSHSSVSSTLTAARWKRTASTATQAQVRTRTLFQRIYNDLKRCVSACLKYKLLPHQGRLWWGLLFNSLSKMCYLWLSGGTWYCFPDIGLNQPVPTGTKWALRLFFRQFTNFLGSDVSGNVQARVCITSARLASGARSPARQGEGEGEQTEQSLKT